MQITGSGLHADERALNLRSPAKINLFLQITGKRPDGYHDLFSLMCCVNLFDDIRLEFDQDEASIVCAHPEVPEDENNLACRAAELFYEQIGRPNRVAITIQKTIPVGAGLGGGSGNAATVLKGLNEHYGFPLDDKTLALVGLSIGADVPYLLYGKPAFARGVGEQLRPCVGLFPYTVLLLNPGFNVSTAMVYKNLNLGLTKCEKKIKSFPFKDASIDVNGYLCNDLESVTISMFPQIGDIKALLLEKGAKGALMSGSGPTVFGLFSDRNSAEKASQSITHLGRDQKFVADMIL